MITVRDGESSAIFDIEEYRGQDVDTENQAIALVTAEDSVLTFLIPFSSRVIDGYRRVVDDDLYRYLEHLGIVWTKTRVVFGGSHFEKRNKS